MHWDREAARFNNIHGASRVPQRQPQSHFLRYAFVHACQQRIVADFPLLMPPGPQELEVVGLKEFLHATAPEVDPVVVDRRLYDVAAELAARPDQVMVPPSMERVSVLSQAEAADMLLDFLEGVREVKRRFCEAMEENFEEWKWYPELLVEVA